MQQNSPTWMKPTMKTRENHFILLWVPVRYISSIYVLYDQSEHSYSFRTLKNAKEDVSVRLRTHESECELCLPHNNPRSVKTASWISAAPLHCFTNELRHIQLSHHRKGYSFWYYFGISKCMKDCDFINC